jgi:hypothetical protein
VEEEGQGEGGARFVSIYDGQRLTTKGEKKGTDRLDIDVLDFAHTKSTRAVQNVSGRRKARSRDGRKAYLLARRR